MTIVTAADVIKELTREALWLHTKWNVLETLFGGEKAAVDVLNRRTAFIFWLIQDGLIDDVMLRTARLLDNPTFGNGARRRHNITLELAVQSLPSHVDVAARTVFTARIEELKIKCEAIISHRNRRIGHVDHDAALNLDPLPPVKWNDIRDAVTDAKQLLSDISIAFDGSQISFLDRADEEQAAQILIRVLELGNEAMDAERRTRTENWRDIAGDRHVEASDNPLDEITTDKVAE